MGRFVVLARLIFISGEPAAIHRIAATLKERLGTLLEWG
jgi:hypothetical protein